MLDPKQDPDSKWFEKSDPDQKTSFRIPNTGKYILQLLKHDLFHWFRKIWTISFDVYGTVVKMLQDKTKLSIIYIISDGYGTEDTVPK